MSSKLPFALFVTLWVWLFVFLITHAVEHKNGRRAKLGPQSTPMTSYTPRPTPTIDRLAAPPTVENPTQADEGAQLFWLHCQPCHGDRGQGLTDEWRAQYPPEDQNCWESGCHGRRPYENGFTLPTAVPAVTSDESLERFESMAQVYGYMSSAMPYQNPGHLSEEEYLAITAFLARAHDVWDGTPLTTENAVNFRLHPVGATATPEPTPLFGITPNDQNNNQDNLESGDTASTNALFIGIAAVVVVGLIIRIILIQRRM